MATYEVHLDGGLQRVFAIVHVEASSESEARSLAMDKIDDADWEMAYHETVYASDVSISDVDCMDDDETLYASDVSISDVDCMDDDD